MISLGTSDTVLAVVSDLAGGHGVLSNFADPRTGSEEEATGRCNYVRMLCFSNGGKTREEYCKKYCGGDWKNFSKACESGSGARPGWNLVVDTCEITPSIPVGTYRSGISPGDCEGLIRR